jgi:hypothetical protein
MPKKSENKPKQKPKSKPLPPTKATEVEPFSPEEIDNAFAQYEKLKKQFGK